MPLFLGIRKTDNQLIMASGTGYFSISRYEILHSQNCVLKRVAWRIKGFLQVGKLQEIKKVGTKVCCKTFAHNSSAHPCLTNWKVVEGEFINQWNCVLLMLFSLISHVVLPGVRSAVCVGFAAVWVPHIDQCATVAPAKSKWAFVCMIGKRL